MSAPEVDEDKTRPAAGPVDVPIPVAGGGDVERPGMGRAWWLTLTVLALLAAGGAWAILSAVAERRLAELEQEVDACLDASEFDLELDPERCPPKGEVLVTRWPTTRAELAEDAERWRRRIDVITLLRAARLELDAQATQAAASKLLDRPEPPLRRLVEAGAHAELVAHALAAESSRVRDDALDSAATLGDWDAYTELARSVQDDESIAWLCLRDPEAGRAAIEVAREASRTDSHARLRYGSGHLELIARLCGTEVDESAQALAAAGLDRDPSWMVAREAAAGRRSAKAWLEAKGRWRPPAAVLAQAIVREQPSDAELMRWLAPNDWARSLEATQISSTAELDEIRRGRLIRPQQPRYAPAAMLEAAELLAARAELLEPGEGQPPAMSKIHPEVWANPAPVFRRTAAVLASEAAYAWLVRGELDRARRAAQAAESWYAPRHRSVAWGLRLATGEAGATRAWIGLRRDEEDPAVAPGALDMLELHALIAMDEWSEAHALAHERYARALEGSDDPNGKRHAQVWALWHLALVIQLELDERLPGVDEDQAAHASNAAAERSRGDSWGPEDLRELLAVARDPELARRWRALGVAPPYTLSHLPPTPVGRMTASWAAEPELEELWLDQVLPGPEDLGREYFTLRAELARWRGDAEAEARWAKRRAGLLALAHEPDHWILLRLAGF